MPRHPLTRSLSRIVARIQSISLQTAARLTIIGGLLSVLAVLSFLGSAMMADTNERILSRQVALGRLAAHHTDEELAEVETYLSQLAAADFPIVLHVISAPYSGAGTLVKFVTIVAPDGTPLYPEVIPAHAQVVDWRAVRGLDLYNSDTGHVQWSGIFAARDGSPMVAAATRLLDESATGAWLVAALDPNTADMQGLLFAFTMLGETEHSALVDQYQRVIASSDIMEVLGIADDANLHEQVQLSKSLTTLRTHADLADADTVAPHVMTFVPLARAPWSLALGGSEQELLAPVEAWRRQVAILAVLILGIGLVSASAIARVVTQPIGRLTRVATSIGHGDFAQPVPLVGHGEVRTLARSLEDMRHRLKESTAGLQRALADMAAGKALYEGIFQSMGTAVVAVDEQLRVTSVNPAAEVLLGQPAERIIGTACPTLMRSASGDVPAACQTCTVTTATGPAMYGPRQEALLTRSGRPVFVLTTCSRAAVGADQSTRAVRVMRDVSSDEVASLRDEFLGNVSHDLRTPLGHVKGNADLLLRRDVTWDTRTTRDSLKAISSAVDTLDHMLKNLISLSRFNAAGLELRLRRVKVRGLVTQAVRRARPLAGRHRFVLDIPRDIPDIEADATWLGEVLANLLDNAVKYSPAGTVVRVTAEDCARMVCVSVADQGPGVPASEHRAIFVRFRRGENALAQHVAGTGLGLAICQSVVEAHGGRLWVADGPNGGAVFSFTCRRAAAAI